MITTRPGGYEGTKEDIAMTNYDKTCEILRKLNEIHDIMMDLVLDDELESKDFAIFSAFRRQIDDLSDRLAPEYKVVTYADIIGSKEV